MDVGSLLIVAFLGGCGYYAYQKEKYRPKAYVPPKQEAKLEISQASRKLIEDTRIPERRHTHMGEMELSDWMWRGLRGCVLQGQEYLSPLLTEEMTQFFLDIIRKTVRAGSDLRYCERDFMELYGSVAPLEFREHIGFLASEGELEVEDLQAYSLMYQAVVCALVAAFRTDTAEEFAKVMSLSYNVILRAHSTKWWTDEEAEIWFPKAS